MMVMPSNNSKMLVGYLAGKHPGKIGWLLSTDGGWRAPHAWLPYAIDNGAFPAWTNGRPWNAAAFWERLEAQAGLSPAPLWVVVPDVVADRAATLASWVEHSGRIREMGYRLAFAAQDGMTPKDVPVDADVVFIGGTTEWKWRNLPVFCRHHPRVHCARVNSERLLWLAHEAGAESCDGTGWFRGDQQQLAGLMRYLAESGSPRPQLEFSF